MPYQSGKVAVALLLFGLVGCAPPPRTTVNVIGDKFSTVVTLEGLERDDRFDGNVVSWLLRSFVDPGKRSVAHQIYVEWFFPGHGNARYVAADDTARPLAVAKILKEDCGSKCGQVDTVGIAIDEATLRARAANGFQVKLSDNTGGAAILDITPVMIAAQLEAENRVLGATPAAAAGIERGSAANSASVLNLPYDPNAPGASASNAPPYSVKDNGIGIGTIPMLGSKINASLLADGLEVASVAPGSPADIAGIKIGDIMTSFDGHSLSNIPTASDAYNAAAAQAIAKPGSTITVELVRAGKRIKLSIHL